MRDYLTPNMSHRAEGKSEGQRLGLMWPGMPLHHHSSMDAS